MTHLLQELSPMSSFHLKLYFMMADKNTNAGQSVQQTAQSQGSAQTGHSQSAHSGMGAHVQPSKQKKQKLVP